MRKILSTLLLPLAALLSLPSSYAQSESDDAADGYFDEVPSNRAGALPGTEEQNCDRYFRWYHLNSICEFAIDTGHHLDRMAVFSDKALDEKKAYQMAYDRMRASKDSKDGVSGAAQGDLDSFMTRAQVSKAIANMCKKAFKSCKNEWCKAPGEAARCEILSVGQSQFDKDAQQHLQNAFKSAESVKQATGQPVQ